MSLIQNSCSSADIVNGLQESGLCRGDLVYLQVADTAFRAMDSSLADVELFELLLNAVREVIGQEGTLYVPTFSLSFAHREVFDPERRSNPGKVVPMHSCREWHAAPAARTGAPEQA